MKTKARTVVGRGEEGPPCDRGSELLLGRRAKTFSRGTSSVPITSAKPKPWKTERPKGENTITTTNSNVASKDDAVRFDDTVDRDFDNVGSDISRVGDNRGAFGGGGNSSSFFAPGGEVSGTMRKVDVSEAGGGGVGRQRLDLDEVGGGGGGGGGRLRGSPRRFADAAREAKPLHDKGFRGAGVRVAVFDTGLDAGSHDFGNVVEQINWTNEDSLTDGVGHGTHIAGVIAGRDEGCSGFAPEAELFIFRVFSSEQVSYTSWFLDAFNYALFLGVDIVNLSIGGPDFMDQPFVEKVRELSANGILVVSAVGNDGPLYGTQHNPADQADTIGVGATSIGGDAVASFQSRGMTTWELPGGYGRVKPDLIAAGEHVLGPKAGGAVGQCSALTGTSVASPVIAGAAALLASTVPEDLRSKTVNPASIKQVLTESARRVKGAGVFEQGAGALDLVGAFELLSRYTPRASFLPPSLDLTDPYMWPFRRQALYYGAMPTLFNVTIANGMGVTGYITSLSWKEEIEPLGDATESGGDVLKLEADYPEVLWPWSGFLALALRVSPSRRDFEGIVRGKLEVGIESEAGTGESQPRKMTAVLPITASVIRTPPKRRRLLWDQFHSVPYPPAYVPRDYLGDDSDMLDKLGDHPHTNFRTLYGKLLDAGYYVEILGSDWTQFDAEDYGALLLVDPEAGIGDEEKEKLVRDVKEKGLSLVVFADWYSEDVMSQVEFVDDNTRRMWTAVTGGCNVPALNSLLLPGFGMALGGTPVDGVFSLAGREVHLASGNVISRMPPGGAVITAEYLEGVTVKGSKKAQTKEVAAVHKDLAVIGAFDTNTLRTGKRASREGVGGRVFLFGDSSCADDAALGLLKGTRKDGSRGGDCLWLFKSAVRYACEGFTDLAVFRDAKWIPDESRGVFDKSGAAEGFSDGLPVPMSPPTNEDENEEDEDDGGVYREGSRALADMSGPSERSSASVVE